MKTEKDVCRCPYCDTPVSGDSSVCAPCQVKLVPCSKCGKPRADSSRRCPHCGDSKPASRVRRT